MKYLKEICCLASDQHLSFICFQENAFVNKTFPKSSGLFVALSGNGLKTYDMIQNENEEIDI